MEQWHFGQHARERIVQMGLSAREVNDALFHPDLKLPSMVGPPGEMVWQKGRIGLVIIPKDRFVKTVVWKRHTGDPRFNRGHKEERS